MKKLPVIVLLALTIPCLAIGQDAPTEPPKPGPEHQKLAGLVGDWITEGAASENPFYSPEKWSGKIRSEWFSGNFAVVRHVDGKSSVIGEIRSLDVIAYDAAAKTYTWYSIGSLGGTTFGKAAIVDDALTVVWETQVKEKPYKVRGTLKGLSSDRLNWVAEYSEDGQTWTPYFQSTDTRVKSE